MIDKEIEAGIKRACECDCAPPSTGWTVNPFPIIRDYIERIKHRAEVAEKALKLVSECDELLDAFCELIGDDNCDFKCHTCLYNYFLQQAESEIEEEKGE